MVIATNSSTNATSGSASVQRLQALFFAAAAWNVAGATMGLLFLEPLSKLAWPGSTLLSDPISVQFTMMVFGLIGVLALSYVLVALDPSRNRGLVLTAAVGKSVVLMIGIYFSWSTGTAWLLIPAGGVAFFTLSFWWFLFSTRESGWY